jgi:hypothetical protein
MQDKVSTMFLGARAAFYARYENNQILGVNGFVTHLCYKTASQDTI